MSDINYLDTQYRARLAYRQTPGQGPGVIFLTGFMSNMDGSKATYIEDYVTQRGNNFLRFDYRGHGSSSDEFANGTISDWVHDAITVIDELTEGPQILVGSSMGGWIMLRAALQRQDRIVGLLGLASAPDFTRIIHSHYMSEEQQSEMQKTGKIKVSCDYDDSPYIITQKLLDDGEQNCLLDSPIPLTMPVRLVHGMQDQDVPWQTSLTLCERLESEDIETLFIKQGDHRLSTEKDLKRITQTLGQLLDQLEKN